MSKVHRFSAKIYKEGSNYLVDVPASISTSLAIRTFAPVVGTLNGHSFRGTMVPTGGGRHRLFINREARHATGAGEGTNVELAVQRDTTSREAPMPDDFLAGVEAIAGARQRWDSYPPSHRREMLTWINDAKKSDTRARRIARAVAQIMGD